MRLSSEDLYRARLGLFDREGFKVYGHTAPRLALREQLYFGDPAAHRCEDSQVVHLSPFLVLPVQSVQSVDRLRAEWRGEAGFGAYWVSDAFVTHFEWHEPTDRRMYRPATRLETFCAFLQNDSLGSLRTVDCTPSWPCVEVCRWRGAVKFHRAHLSNYSFPGEHHHRLWIRISSVPTCVSTRDLVLVD